MFEHQEIERKYLIRYPDVQALVSHPDCEIWNLHQVYLTAIRNNVRRLRKMECNGITRYVFTEKRNITDLACFELERELTEKEYNMMLDEVDPKKEPICKTRYRIDYEGNMCEIDIYPFWSHQAVMEVELASEDAEVHIPTWVEVIREVTGETDYRNSVLAERVPDED